MRYNEWTGTRDEWNSLPPYKQARYKAPKKAGDDHYEYSKKWAGKRYRLKHALSDPRRRTTKEIEKAALDPNKPAKEQKERKTPPGRKPPKPSGKTAQRKRRKAKESEAPKAAPQKSSASTTKEGSRIKESKAPGGLKRTAKPGTYRKHF